MHVNKYTVDRLSVTQWVMWQHCYRDSNRLWTFSAIYRQCHHLYVLLDKSVAHAQLPPITQIHSHFSTNGWLVNRKKKIFWTSLWLVRNCHTQLGLIGSCSSHYQQQDVSLQAWRYSNVESNDEKRADHNDSSKMSRLGDQSTSKAWSELSKTKAIADEIGLSTNKWMR